MLPICFALLVTVVSACAPRYTVRERSEGWSQSGTACWYGTEFHGRRTAGGEIFDQNKLTAAHPSLPFGTIVRVTNTSNDQSVLVRINDRGPWKRGRIIDLSRAAAEQIDMVNAGLAEVEIEVVHTP
ncbi:MAG: septal ring lytic transglycosylase RlpA family protein [Deltaproteobacteria bacterium]|nr:septal ring lytic transglycosylase RlpA family protein [Deltaproteobacteria bacterium]